MAVELKCPCGKTFTCSPYGRDVQKRKHCSRECYYRFHVRMPKAESLSVRLSVPMTERQRQALNTQARAKGKTPATLARQYIVSRLPKS